MHIGIVTSEFPPDIGGVETYAAEFAQSLAAMGHKVSVFVHKKHQITKQATGITLFPLLGFSRQLDRPHLLSSDVDAWHVMNAAHSWLALETDKPVVVSIHGNDFLNPYPLTIRPPFSSYLWRLKKLIKPLDIWLSRKLTQSMLHKALPAARIILSNSTYTQDVFLKKFPQCQGKTLISYVGVGERFLASPLTNKNNATPHFLTVSRLSEPRKNVDKVLQALGKLNSQFDFRYTVIGDGSEKLSLEATANKLGLAEKVTFLGRQPIEQVIDSMAATDLFILTSSTMANSHEGFGIVYLEAAACGTPSLATHQAGAIEAVGNERSGFFVEEPTVENIKQALARFLTHEYSFNRHACREFASGFTWQKVVEHALPYYSQD